MKNRFGILAVGVLAACGSSNGTNGTAPPAPTNYTYGAGTPVATGTMQEQAANDANENTQEVVNATQNGSVSDNASTLSNAPQIPNAIISDLGDGAMAVKNPTYSVVGKLAKATKSGKLDTGCYTVNGNTITYNSCNLGDQDFTYTISGSLTATPTAMNWNIKASFSFNDTTDNESESLVGTWTGSLTFDVSSTDAIVDGTATAAYTGNVVGSGENINFAYTAQVVFKSLDVSTTCDDGGGAVAGKLDVSVTAVASNGTAADDGFENFGYEFSWTGCDQVNVATGTAN
jgi:hypothetical protein